MKQNKTLKKTIILSVLSVCSGLIWIFLLFQDWFYYNILGNTDSFSIRQLREFLIQLKEIVAYAFDKFNKTGVADALQVISILEVISVVFMFLAGIAIICQFIYFCSMLGGKLDSKKIGMLACGMSIGVSALAIIGLFLVNLEINRALMPINQILSTYSNTLNSVASFFGYNSSVSLGIDGNQIIQLTSIPYIAIIPALVEMLIAIMVNKSNKYSAMQ